MSELSRANMVRVRRALVLAGLLALAACGGEDDPVVASSDKVDVTTTSAAATTATEPTAMSVPPTEPTSTAPTTSMPTTTATTAPPPRQRAVADTSWTPYATVGGVTLHHPSMRVERVGFHESNHDGAQFQEPLPTAVNPTTLETRDRDTNAHGASDIVVDPAVEIRAPVTGTIIRGGTYVLYCDHSDQYVVIEPDEHPGWEIKVLHIDGLRVGRGERVVAGETVLADRPTQLPFESQIDELRTADPAWPHVHIEVVDPTIPDRPSPGGGCS